MLRIATDTLYPHLRKWSKELSLADQGIVVGADMNQEWLLPWWWEHYSKSETLPVAFADFGLSEEGRAWCTERGTLIRLRAADIFVADRSEIDPLLMEKMELQCGRCFWPSRNAWFKKPLACLQSPFKRSLWIDLDCQIQGALVPLFAFFDRQLGLALDEGGGYNSGVIGFTRTMRVIEDWADLCFTKNHLFRGDQDVLNEILATRHIPVSKIPAIYNWSRCFEHNPQAIILHWHGPHGKAVISHQILRSQWVQPILES